MRLKLIAVVCILALVSILTGCESIPTEHRGAAVGAGVGAATGAAAGGLLGRDVGSAAIGGLAGALVGGAIGHYAYDQRRSREETEQVYNYIGTDGQMVTIEDVQTEPRTVRPGDEVDLNMTYAVLTPEGESKATVIESREIRYKGELVGNPRARVARTGGTYASSVPLQLSPNAQRGEYTVTYSVQSGDTLDTKQSSFRVQ